MDAQTPATQSSPGDSPVQDNPTRQGPATASPTTASPTTASPTTQNPPAVEKSSRPARPKGPNASAVVLGLVAMVLAGLIIASETMSLRVDWSQLGPGAIVGIGLLLVVLGAIGLVRRHDDA